MRSFKIRSSLHQDTTYFFIANILYSLSSMMVNVCLPKVLPISFFDDFIYVFQMVLFLTNVSQIGIIIGLYRYIQQARQESLCLYYTSTLAINAFILALGFWTDSPITQALKLDSLTAMQQVVFYCSVATSGIFLYNKGKNVADKDYRYMVRISVTAFLLRVIALGVLWYTHASDISLCLILLFILPFVQDIYDYIVHTFQFVSFRLFDKKLFVQFFVYCVKIWIAASLFNIADRIFMIHTKGLDTSFTTALAFSAGFVGIVSLFNNSFYNFFLSKLNEQDLDAIRRHINRLHHIAPIYFISLLALCSVVSGCVLYAYPELGQMTAVICFIVLLRTGFNSFVGMYSLLSKVLDMLSFEILLGVLRVAYVWCLCSFWHPADMTFWYAVVTFTIPLPEIILALSVTVEVRRRSLQGY